MVRQMQDLDSSSSSSRAASPIKNASEEDDMKQDNFVSPLLPFIGNDPNQMVILSGPFPSEDSKSNIIIIRPVPPGYTLVAKPMIGAPPAPLLLQQDQLRQVDASECSAVQQNTEDDTDQAHNVVHGQPLVMMWTNQTPQGKLVPMFQPQPPVYFQERQPNPHR